MVGKLSEGSDLRLAPTAGLEMCFPSVVSEFSQQPPEVGGVIWVAQGRPGRLAASGARMLTRSAWVPSSRPLIGLCLWLPGVNSGVNCVGGAAWELAHRYWYHLVPEWCIWCWEPVCNVGRAPDKGEQGPVPCLATCSVTTLRSRKTKQTAVAM